MKKYNFVYCTSNLITGQKYIGDHSTDNLDDGYIGSGRPLFQNAKKKYGVKNFKRDILEFFNTKEEAYKAQEKYIRLFETHVSQGGYNLNWRGGKGPLTQEMRNKIGDGNKGKSQTEEAKKKIGEFRKGKEPWNKGIKGVIKHSDESNKKKGRPGKSNSFYEKKHSSEAIEKMRNAKLGENNPMHTNNKK